MSEKAIAAGVRAAIQSLAEFEDVDVVENDYSILDQSLQNAPYTIIGTSDEFISEQDVETPETSWELPLTLVEVFVDWPTTLGNIRDRRQAIIDKINSDDARSAGGLEAVSINEIRSAGPLLPTYPPWLDRDLEPASDPIYIMAPMILVCEEF